LGAALHLLEGLKRRSFILLITKHLKSSPKSGSSGLHRNNGEFVPIEQLESLPQPSRAEEERAWRGGWPCILKQGGRRLAMSIFEIEKFSQRRGDVNRPLKPETARLMKRIREGRVLGSAEGSYRKDRERRRKISDAKEQGGDKCL